MFINSKTHVIATAIFLVYFSAVISADGAMDPRFELDPQTIAGAVSTEKKPVKSAVRPVRARKERKASRSIPSRRLADGSHKMVHSLHLMSPDTLSELERLIRIREVWDKIVQPAADSQKPLSFQTTAFSLTLDPQRYPAFSTMDGGRIILDADNTIPSLVKALIEENDPTVRVVSEPPAGNKHFVSSMLKSAGFFSVEENFSLDFGADPKLTFHADFKIEKKPDSFDKQDIVLMNSGQNAVPPAWSSFLKREGFSLYEPFASYRQYSGRKSQAIQLITVKNQSEVVDAILEALSISPDTDRSLDIYAVDNNGISLAVKADRYFERGGKRYVISRFDGDPVTYTLFRILEQMRYQVVILEDRDDFRRVAEKIISRMKIKGTFAQYNLLKNGTSNFSLQMSGFKLEDVTLPDGGIFLTNLTLPPIFSDVLRENGFSITGK